MMKFEEMTDEELIRAHEHYASDDSILWDEEDNPNDSSVFYAIQDEMMLRELV